jgi:ABC-type phosphate transport system substrate-binding protein
MKVKVLSAALMAVCAQGAFGAPATTLYGGGATFPAAAYGGVEWLTGPNTGTAAAPIYASLPSAPITRLISGGAPGSFMAVYAASTAVKPFAFPANIVAATTIVSGKNYTIKTLGDTNWASLGVTVTPAIGVQFTASASGSGTGTANLNVRPSMSYCQTGSGGGKNVFIGTRTADFVATSGNANGLSCGNFNTSGIPFGAGGGFSAPASQTDADFVGTDAPMSSSEYSTFKNNKSSTRGVPVQIPVAVGAVGLVYNNVNTGKSLGSAPLAISMSEACQIFSGAISNWSSFGYPSKPIKVVYRSDKSGTSFGFSNALSAMCTAEGVTGFTTQETFASAFPLATPPAGSIAASGNAGVIDAVGLNDGAIGYGDVNDAVARQRITPTLNDVNFFSVRAKLGINSATTKLYIAKSPLKVGKTFKLPVGAVVFDKTYAAGANDLNGRPTLTDIAGVPSARAGCMALVTPDSYGNAPLDANGNYSIYPFQAVTYLLFNANGNGENAVNLQQLAGSFYGPATAPAIKASVTSISPTNGFSYIAGYGPTAQIKNCIGF